MFDRNIILQFNVSRNFLFSKKGINWQKRHLKYANQDLIYLLRCSKADSELLTRNPKKSPLQIAEFFTGIRPATKPIICDDDLQAILISESIIKKGLSRNSIFINEINSAYSVYVIELLPEVWKEKKFLAPNTHAAGGPAFYVGQTSKTPEERFLQHKAGEHSNKFVQLYSANSFKEIFCKELMLDSGIPFEDLTEGQSLLSELALTHWIRAQGMGAYSG